MTLQFIIGMIASASNDRLQRKLDDEEEERRILQEQRDAATGGKKQMARNLTDGVDGFLRNATYLMHDRDLVFTEAFEAILREPGVKCLKIPAQGPSCNPYAGRFVKTLRHECWRHCATFGEPHLRYLLKEFLAHYHPERSHQGFGGQWVENPRGRLSAGDDLLDITGCRLIYDET